MLVPKIEHFTAIIGGTFNPVITLFESLPQSYWRGDYSSTVRYPANAAVKASNGNMYLACDSNLGIDPATDTGDHWRILNPYDLTGYDIALKIGLTSPTITLSNNDGLIVGDSSGIISVNATADQTSIFTAGKQHYYLQLTGPGNDVIFPMKGTVNFITP